MARVLHHVITETQDVGLRICHGLDAASAAHLATAYLTVDGLARFEEALSEQVVRGKALLLVGVWDYITDPRALRSLLRLQRKHPPTLRRGLEVRLASGFGFHWKLALLASASSHVVLIGSSNLTGKGTAAEGEVNLEIRGTKSLHEELRVRFTEEFERGRPLDDESVKGYERDYKRYPRLRRRLSAMRKQGERKFPGRRRRSSTQVFEPGTYAFTHIGDIERDSKVSEAADEHQREELSSVRGVCWFSNITTMHSRRCEVDRPLVIISTIIRVNTKRVHPPYLAPAAWTPSHARFRSASITSRGITWFR